MAKPATPPAPPWIRIVSPAFSFSVSSTGADRRQPGERQCRGIDMRQAIGLLGDNGRLDRDLLGIGALLADVADAEHLIADTQVGDACPQRLKRRRRNPVPRM